MQCLTFVIDINYYCRKKIKATFAVDLKAYDVKTETRNKRDGNGLMDPEVSPGWWLFFFLNCNCITGTFVIILSIEKWTLLTVLGPSEVVLPFALYGQAVYCLFKLNVA